ncbi:MAG: DUF2752 domain-containing protein [Treponema sp.]|nr:DUF2752 domain-containing protein [Treponema sp.]
MILLIGSLYFVFVSVTGHGIPCIIYKFFGVKCPGCGMTRAAVCLGKGDFRSAFSFNALSLTVMPVLVVYLIFRQVKEYKGGKGFSVWEYILLVILFVVTVLYTIMRNIK